MLFLPRSETEDHLTLERSTESAWTKAMPPVVLAAQHYDAQGHVLNGYGNHGSIVSEIEAKRLELPVDHRVVRVPGRLCVHGILLSELTAAPDIRDMLDFAAQQGYALSGDVYARLLFQRLPAEQHPLAVHEVWVPVSRTESCPEIV